MKQIRNVLFIMCDQLRWDHLGCYGHPALRTRNIDALAARGLRFERAFVTAGVCGPSRMSYYTGRYVSSHGATANLVPLPLGETTLGEYLLRDRFPLHLVGKTHVLPDKAAFSRLRIELSAQQGLLACGHFLETTRHDGHHAEKDSRYADWLRSAGYDSNDPWTDYVVSALAEDGSIVSGWNMRNAGLAARVAEPHSETAYAVETAIDFVRKQGDNAWALHLSLVKPHWPYLAPAPYHSLYSLDDCLPLQRHKEELTNAHEITRTYRENHEECINFFRADVSDTVRPTYQGLIQQIDDRLGMLWDVLAELGRWDDTLIVFTADHGDFLGDHWLGEKELFYDTVQKVPLIVHDPTEAADATRGTANSDFVSAVDIVPTILDALSLPDRDHRVEGRSLLPLLHGDTPISWRDCVISELDFSFRQARLSLGYSPRDCRGWMVRTEDWKYIHWQRGRASLFNLRSDPEEFFDLGAEPGFESVQEAMRKRLLSWFTALKPRVTVETPEVLARTARHKQAGAPFGMW
ncbi:MAG: sulfatase-like hydrolase/transferase [Paraburkholderia sp.]|jgi:arylsulfatase A-like enzyme|nr:sulfatase-like hydrolase/transferase [Paraburkholderia sp.]